MNDKKQNTTKDILIGTALCFLMAIIWMVVIFLLIIWAKWMLPDFR